MDLYLAGIAAESNTFVATRTTWDDFAAFELFHGDATAHPERAVYGRILARWRRGAEAKGHRVHEGLCAAAESGGPVERDAWIRLRDESLAGLAAAGPVDAVILNLHGAMVAEGCDDCEGELLSRVRAAVGPDRVVGALLDLHCHLTPAMLAAADVLVAYKEYPHTDVFERADELMELCLAAAAGRVSPVTSVFDCRMVGSWPTTAEPMRTFVRDMRAAERGAVLSVSLGHGYPWADVADVGARLWVIADGDAAAASAQARRLGLAFYGLREETARTPASVAQAVAALREPTAEGPVILADIADNPGGGAPGDATFVLSALLDAGIRDAAVGALHDPSAVALARAAGEGARLRLRLGGHSGAQAGGPLELEVEVLAVRDRHFQTGLLGEPESMGSAVALRTAGVDVIACSLRVQTFAPDAFTGLGVALEGKRAVVVKSAQHFHAAFAPLAARVMYVQAPGPMPDVRSISYTRRDANYWPRVRDPIAAAT